MAAPKKATAKKTATKPVKKTDKRGAPKGPGHRGNVKFVATAEQRIRVEAMVACGTTYQVIADLMGFSKDTLERHFRAELDHGKERALAKIGGSYVQKALAGDDLACRYVLSRIGGWKQTTTVESTGLNGGPIQHEHREKHDFSKLSREEKRELETLLAKAAGGDEPA